MQYVHHTVNSGLYGDQATTVVNAKGVWNKGAKIDPVGHENGMDVYVVAGTRYLIVGGSIITRGTSFFSGANRF